MVGLADKCLFHQGGDLVTPLLTTSVSPGAQLHETLQEMLRL